jgi:hypothetical protein
MKKYYTKKSHTPTKREDLTIENLLSHKRIQKLLYPEHLPSKFQREYWTDVETYLPAIFTMPSSPKLEIKLEQIK